MGCNSSVELCETTAISKETINIVQESWKTFTDINTLAEHGTNMVIRLFTAHSEIRYLWKFAQDLKTEEEMRQNGKLKYHGKRIMETVGISVKSLENIEVLDVLLTELGNRHFSYGALPNHFMLVKESFIYVFSNALGSKFTPEVAKAWEAIFQYIVKRMLDGMKDSAMLNQGGIL